MDVMCVPVHECFQVGRDALPRSPLAFKLFGVVCGVIVQVAEVSVCRGSSSLYTHRDTWHNLYNFSQPRSAVCLRPLTRPNFHGLCYVSRHVS